MAGTKAHFGIAAGSPSVAKAHSTLATCDADGGVRQQLKPPSCALRRARPCPTAKQVETFPNAEQTCDAQRCHELTFCALPSAAFSFTSCAMDCRNGSPAVHQSVASAQGKLSGSTQGGVGCRTTEQAAHQRLQWRMLACTQT